jgi:hypothetical protein
VRPTAAAAAAVPARPLRQAPSALRPLRQQDVQQAHSHLVSRVLPPHTHQGRHSASCGSRICKLPPLLS